MEENIKRNSPLWLEDGNVILTTASAAFKVHRGILERHSPIFRDLFSFPQPLTKSVLEGAPAVCMYDEPGDLEYFLLALYDGLHIEQRRASNFPIIRGVLRLSIKYHVERLRLECLKLLQHDWPTTLAGWDLREREATDSEGVYESAKIRPHPIFIINLVHELGPVGATLLPAAFYDLSRYNCSHIWTGIPALFQKPPDSTSTCTTGTVRLSTRDLETVMVGKEASQTFIAQFLRRELEERKVAVFCEHGSYEDGRVCRIAFDVLVYEVYRGIVGVTCGRDSDPLFTLNAAVSLQAREVNGSLDVHPASRACEQCRAVFAQVASAARCYVWDHIPCWFGLEAVFEYTKGRLCVHLDQGDTCPPLVWRSMVSELKRQRTTEELDNQARMLHNPTESESIRQSDLWFDDGSVVLRAKDPSTLFRVHRALMARHSEVFRHMFSMPQPEDREETEIIEGCPVVDIHDSANDMSSLLRALYDGPNWGDNGIEDFEAVSGVLRLSHKYLIDSLRTKAIDHLQKAWPVTLQGWDAREEIARWYNGEWNMSGGRYPHPIRVIDLARAVNAHSLLPSAFYDISRSTFSVIFESSPSLSHADTQKLALGKEASHAAVTNLITTLGSGRCTSSKSMIAAGKCCHSPVSCRKDFSELVELATQHYLFDRERGSTDPLYVADELGQLKSAEFSECKACAYALEHWSTRERERIWKSIPTWFRLDGWDCCS